LATTRHKVFVSFHHDNDEAYKNEFIRRMGNDIVNWSVEDGDINPNDNPDNIFRLIREKYLRDSTVTVVLIGKETWKRKFVDWEIYSSLRNTIVSPRSGLLGILLPCRGDCGQSHYDQYTVPPRLYDNNVNGYAKVVSWTQPDEIILNHIHDAFVRRDTRNPDLSRPLYANNRTNEKWSN